MLSTALRRRALAVLAAGALATGLLAACGGSGEDSPGGGGKDRYTIYLSATVVGNDWLQQMLRSAEAAVSKPPLAGRVDLRVEQVEATEQAQINSLNNIITQSPDAILVHANSTTALNPTIERACDKGIVVVTYSQVATAPCAYKVNTNWAHVNNDIPTWLANAMGGEGKVIVDRGLPGSPISEASTKRFLEVLGTFPGIEIVGYYTSNYEFGKEKEGVASLLAANPQIDGILSTSYGTGAIQALKEAGRPLVPIAMFAYNGSATACVQEPGLKCMVYTHPPYLSAEALKLAVDVLDGHPPADRLVENDYPRLTTDLVSGDFDGEFEQLEIGKNVFPDLPPGLVLPASPSWVEITPQEASGVGA
ncbi:MAG: substrate-binding domain-containing protein [Frankia sp.]|nr:substrate-binding domain-containing protein [Frankia sp.]